MEKKQECICGPIGCVRWDEHDIYCPCALQQIHLPEEYGPEIWDTVNGLQSNHDYDF